MSQPNSHIPLEDRLRDELKDASFLPSPSVWERIDAALPPAPSPWYIKYRMPIAASVAMLAIVGTLLIRQQFKSLEQQYTESTGVYLQPAESFAGASAKNLVKENTSAKTRATAAQISQQDKTETSPSITATSNSLAATSSNIAQQGLKTNIKGSQQQKTDGSIAAKAGQKESKSNLSSGADALSANASSITFSKEPQSLAAPLAEASNALEYITGYQPEPLPTPALQYPDDEVFNQTISNGKKLRKSKKYDTGKGFYMGPTFGMNYNFLSKQGIDKDTDLSALQYRPHAGSSFGLGFGYDFSSRLGIVVDWIYSSDEGQRFVAPGEDGLIPMSIQLDYMKFPVMLKYKQQFLNQQGNMPISLNLLGGFHYSVLRSRNTFIDGELAYFDQKHNQHQWGMMAGTEIDFHFSRNIFLTLGTRAGFSSGTDGLPRMKGRDGSNPVAFQAGAYARMNIRLARKAVPAAAEPANFSAFNGR